MSRNREVVMCLEITFGGFWRPPLWTSTPETKGSNPGTHSTGSPWQTKVHLGEHMWWRSRDGRCHWKVSWGRVSLWSRMRWFISIMTPFCVTRQFHCPEVYFLSPSSLGWRLFSKGCSADGMARDQTGNAGGGFSKHTWAIRKFGCVSWRSDNK